jgi:carboxypeptidase family protein
MPTCDRISLAILVLAAQTSIAQSTGAIGGVVRDSANQPVAAADVVLIPAKRHARTDSLGRFEFLALEDGEYVVRARRIGYGPAEWSVKLAKGGRVNVTLDLGPRIAMLDTVVVAGSRLCPRDTYEGFMCRRAGAKGTFIDYIDIDTMEVYYSADLLRDVEGFHTLVQPTRTGLTRTVSTKRCTVVLMNGVPARWSDIPEAPYMVTGIEVYKKRDEIPKEFARYTWGKEDCWLVAYWTYDFTYKPVRRVSPGKP